MKFELGNWDLNNLDLISMPINQSQNITSAEILALARRERFLHIYHLLPSVVAAACFLIFLSSLYAKDFIGSSNLLFESSGNFFW